MKSLLSILILAILGSLAPLSVSSQTSNPLGLGNAEGFKTIRMRTMGLERIPDVGIFYYGKSDFEKLPIANFRPSSSMPVTISVDGILTLLKRVENPEGGYLYNPFVQLRVPSDSRQIILFAAMSGGDVTFKAVADNLSPNARDWLYINTTQTPIAVQLGEDNKPVGVAPGQSVSHRAEVEAGSGAAIRVAAYKEDKWDLVYSRFWPIYENQRSMVIFIEEAGEVKVYNFFEAVVN